MFFMQLATSGTMPDSINGVEMDIHLLRKARSNYRFQPKTLDAPQAGLYPLFESASGRVNLEMPDDYFRIRNQFEFLDAKTNKLIEGKSTAYTEALTKKGFAFPARIIAGIPTTKKSCDEGYLIADAQQQLFHLKMEGGKPYVKRVGIPADLSFLWIECVDFSNKQYYAYLISTKNEVYVLMQDTYELVKLPVDGFNPTTDELKISGDLFNYNVVIEGDNYIRNIALDDKFKKIDEYSEKWEDKYHRLEGKIFAVIFPFEMTLNSDLSRFIDFRTRYSDGIMFLIFSLLLLLLQISWILHSKKKLKNHLVDLFIISTTGLFGFLAVNIFPNKHYN